MTPEEYREEHWDEPPTFWDEDYEDEDKENG